LKVRTSFLDGSGVNDNLTVTFVRCFTQK